MNDKIFGLLTKFQKTAPMAPDFPRGFVPQVVDPLIRESDIVFAKMPDGLRRLIFAVIDGMETDELPTVSTAKLEVLTVSCEDEAELRYLEEMVDRIKQLPRRRAQILRSLLRVRPDST